jgi:hypothetical protein
VTAGELLFDVRESPEDALFLLLVGELELTERRGRERSQRTIFAGTFFNHQRSILLATDAGGAPLAATALTDASLLRVSRESFARLQRTESPLANQILCAHPRTSPSPLPLSTH